MASRTIISGSRHPLATHVAVLSLHSGAITLSVLTEGWPEGDRVHWSVEASRETVTELRRLADALDGALTAAAERRRHG